MKQRMKQGQALDEGELSEAQTILGLTCLRLPVYLSTVYLSIYLYSCLAVYFSIYLSIYLQIVYIVSVLCPYILCLYCALFIMCMFHSVWVKYCVFKCVSEFAADTSLHTHEFLFK